MMFDGASNKMLSFHFDSLDVPEPVNGRIIIIFCGQELSHQQKGGSVRLGKMENCNICSNE